MSVVLLAVWCGACSSPTSPSGSSTQGLPVSQAAIQTIVGNFGRGAANGTNTGTSSIASLGGLLLRPTALTTVQVNQPFSQRTNCQTGGYHEITGRVTGTIDGGGGVSRLQLNATQSIHDYACMETGWLVNGDPYISNTGEIRVTGSSASLDFGQALGWRATNAATGQSFSCLHNVRVTWDSTSGGRLQGTVDCSPPSTTISIGATF